MFIEYAREIEVRQIQAALAAKSLPALTWRRGRIPNIASPAPKVRMRDRAVVAHNDGSLVGDMMTWGWEGPQHPVFTLESERADLADSIRILAPATGFFEHKSGARSSEYYFATLKDEDWFWIPAVAQRGCFALLTSRAAPDMEHICNRHVCLLRPAAGIDWLTMAEPSLKLLLPPEAGQLHVETLHDPR